MSDPSAEDEWPTDDREWTFEDAVEEIEAAHREAMQNLAAERAAQRPEDFWP